MIDVGIRDLKARLSEYLRRADQGEVIRVTDRGTPRWLITPIGDRESVVTQGIREGWISAGIATADMAARVRPTPVAPRPGAVPCRTLAEDRGE